MIKNFNEYLLEKEFNNIIDQFFAINEETYRRTGEYSVEWDFDTRDEIEDLEDDEESNPYLDKLKDFLSKIPKEKIREYFVKLMNKLKSLSVESRRSIILNCLKIFLAFTTLNYLIPDVEQKALNTTTEFVHKAEKTVHDIDKTIEKEIILLTRKSNFHEAQKSVELVEAGYSDDPNDSGNYVNVKVGGGKTVKRLVGTNRGIAAPTLQKYLGRTPKAEDMKKLTKAQAVDILKSDYWEPQNIHLFVDQNIANIVYDGCVNQGVGQMMDIMDKCIKHFKLKAKLGNPFNSKIVKKFNRVDPRKLFDHIKKLREETYKEAASWEAHGKGWMKRLNDIKYKHY
jgi:lysozyme family protein